MKFHFGLQKSVAVLLGSLLLLSAAGCNSDQRDVYDQFAREGSAGSKSSSAPVGRKAA